MERQLVEQAQQGDQRAFEALVRLSANRLFAIAYRILRDHHLAEDALQQTLITIWDELPRLRDPDPLRSLDLPTHRPDQHSPGTSGTPWRTGRQASA